MEKIFTWIFVVFISFTFASMAQAEEIYIESLSEIPTAALTKVSFEDKKAFLEEVDFLKRSYFNNLSAKIFRNIYEEFNKTPASCEKESEDVIKCINESIHKAYTPELLYAHRPENYSDVYFKGQLEDSETEEEFLKNATLYGLEADKRIDILSERYKTAYKAISGVFAQVYQSLPKRTNLTSEQEDAISEKLRNVPTTQMNADERNLYKQLITRAIIKTNIPEILHDLRPYMNIFFGCIIENSSEKERIARGAINSLIKINRKELDKKIKEVLSDFDKRKD
jgi:hypothetical protein